MEQIRIQKVLLLRKCCVSGCKKLISFYWHAMKRNKISCSYKMCYSFTNPLKLEQIWIQNYGMYKHVDEKYNNKYYVATTSFIKLSYLQRRKQM